MSAVNVLAVLDARIARLKLAVANDEIALVPANYRAGVAKLHRDELASTEAAREIVAELIAATKPFNQIVGGRLMPYSQTTYAAHIKAQDLYRLQMALERAEGAA